MILETLRIVSDWLGHEDYGVNALLPGVPRDAGDPEPEPVAVIADPTRDARCARWEAPLDLPAVYVTVDGPAIGKGEVATVNRDYDSIVVAVRYMARNPDSEESARDTYYVLRALVRSIREMLRNENDAARERNGVWLHSAQTIQYGQWQEDVGDAMATGVVAVTFNLRDKAP